MRNKAQSTLEYMFFLGVFLVALIAAAFYLKRGFQGNWRNSATQLGEGINSGSTIFTAGENDQYEPGRMHLSNSAEAHQTSSSSSTGEALGQATMRLKQTVSVSEEVEGF
jgi:hypothetical protein